MIKATKKWIFLKISGATLIPLMLWFIINLINFYDQGYYDVVNFFTNSSSKFLFLKKMSSSIKFDRNTRVKKIDKNISIETFSSFKRYFIIIFGV